MIRVYATRYDTRYRLSLTRGEAECLDNGALFSCGLTVGKDLTQVKLDQLIRAGRAVEVTREEWQHSGCQSRCTLRGDSICQW